MRNLPIQSGRSPQNSLFCRTVGQRGLVHRGGLLPSAHDCPETSQSQAGEGGRPPAYGYQVDHLTGVGSKACHLDQSLASHRGHANPAAGGPSVCHGLPRASQGVPQHMAEGLLALLSR